MHCKKRHNFLSVTDTERPMKMKVNSKPGGTKNMFSSILSLEIIVKIEVVLAGCSG
jgi:hypothetical protein